MSDPLQPWIEKYLLGIAETLGGDLAALKWCDMSEKGQVIRLLTDPKLDTNLWGMLSDGEHSVAVKLLKDAAAEDRQLHDEVLRDNCIVSVQKYKVVSARVPHGNGPGLSPEPRLVIECAAFARSARKLDTKILGTPKPIASHEDLKLWSEGLAKGGGAGNVLKLRKQAALSAPIETPVLPAPPIVVQEKEPYRVARTRAPPDMLFLRVDLTVEPLSSEYRSTFPALGDVDLRHRINIPMAQTPRPQPGLSPAVTPRAGTTTPVRKPLANAMASSSPEVFVDDWELTPPRSRTGTHLPSPSTDQPSSPPVPRISASQLLLSDDTDLPEPEMDEDVLMPEKDQADEKPEDETISSSIPKPPQPTLDEDKMDLDLDPERPISYEQPYPAESRKVPRPPSPKRLSSKDKNGPEIVLVPNSDVSMTGSSQPSQERPLAKVLRKALSQRDVNSQSQEPRKALPSRGIKRSGVQLSQEDRFYDGDEESMEKLGLTRAGKKNRTGGCRSENGRGQDTTKAGKIKRKRVDRFSEYPWPIVSAEQVLEIVAETDKHRGSFLLAHRCGRRATSFAIATTSSSHRSPSSGHPRLRWASTASSSSSIGKLSSPASPPSSLPAQHPGSAPTTSSWRDLFFLLMSVSFACLSIMSLRNPFAELATIALGKSDLQSIFCLLVFSYLTNPTENSFRTYLTEQSFRHHLSRLDDNLDSEQGVHEGLGPRSLPSACISRSVKAPPADRNGPFHFANRASISLRTPKHVFHSFAIFTIAAMVPVHKGSSSQLDETDGWSISDSWYIGVFGKWWRGGVWETWYQDVIARSKDEEGWSSGILSMKNLDMLPDFQAGAFLPRTLPYHLSKQPPPKLRNRDHPVRKSSSRSSSPPPLSKTASLPLHTKRVPATSQSERCDFLPSSKSCMPPVASHSIPARSTLFDQSPLIAEVLRQISASTASVQDLRTQYSEYQATASQSRQILTIELDSHRGRKRQEDASRLEMKSKTKQLDDQKRTAEGLKRDAERKLKAARTTRDNTLQRIEYLDKEMTSLQDRTNDDRAFLAQKSVDVSEVEQELSQALELKRSEIKAAEEALLNLNRRSRELEEKLAMERERLESLKEKTERRLKEQQQSSAAFLGRPMVDGTAEAPYQPRPHATELTSYLPPVHDSPATALDSPSDPVRPDGGYTSLHSYGMYTDDIPLADSPSGDMKGYSPTELDLSPVIRRPQPYPIGHSPTDHRAELSKALQLETDLAFNKAWNGSLYSLPSTNGTSTTASLFSHLTDVQPQDFAYDNDFTQGDGSLNGHYAWSRQDSRMLDELGYIRDDFSNLARGASTGGRSKKGLNPSAKAFSLPRKRSPPGPLNTTSPAYDALNPNGLVTSVLPSASSSLLRAFAPSRAEREALQRALGGSTNNSLERLPSLSEVGSIPSSPTHVDASALGVNPLDLAHSRTAKDPTASKTFNLPSWLTALPNIKKSRFKPWDDDEPLPTTNGNVE